MHVLLKQEDIKRMVEKFLEYVMNNHYVNVNEEPARMLQAFQISLVRIFLFWISRTFFLIQLNLAPLFLLLFHHLSFL